MKFNIKKKTSILHKSQAFDYILLVNTYCGVEDFTGVSAFRYIFNRPLPEWEAEIKRYGQLELNTVAVETFQSGFTFSFTFSSTEAPKNTFLNLVVSF